MLGFNDILGHEQIKEHFRNAVQTGKVSHAYIPVSYTHLDVYKRQSSHFFWSGYLEQINCSMIWTPILFASV